MTSLKTKFRNHREFKQRINVNKLLQSFHKSFLRSFSCASNLNSMPNHNLNLNTSDNYLAPTQTKQVPEVGRFEPILTVVQPHLTVVQLHPADQFSTATTITHLIVHYGTNLSAIDALSMRPIADLLL